MRPLTAASTTKLMLQPMTLTLAILILLSARSNPALAEDEDPVQQKRGRLFSNPFGLLGHDACQTTLEGRNATGICYNEMECLVKGGLFAGYCGPPAIKCICCVFASSNCEKRVTQRIAYFSNPSFPRNDLEPLQCQLNIKPLKDMCWVRFDFEVLELMTDGGGGTCVFDSIGILDGPDGPGGRICGYKSGYSTLTRTPKNGQDLKLSVIVQGPSYRWNVKISQIRCDHVAKLPKFADCGKSNPNGFANEENFNLIRDAKLNKKPMNVISSNRRILDHNPTPVPVPVPVTNAKTRSRNFTRKRIRRRKKMMPQVHCDETRGKCALKQKIRKVVKRSSETSEKSSKSFSLGSISQLSKRKLRTERFFPSFSAKSTFCESKFKVDPVPDPSLSKDPRQSVLLKIIDGTEAGVNEYPWMVSLQLGGAHFCGGSIINEEWILTAAHCMEFGNIKDFLSRMQISISDHDTTLTGETQSITRSAVEVIYYPVWHNLAGASGDVALLKLDSPVTFSQTIGPICLPENAKDAYGGILGTTIGWGVTEEGDVSNVLREVQLNIIDNITCYENYIALDIPIQADMICTFLGPLGTENICSGDSGSPLMVQDASGRFTHVGLTSFSLADCLTPFPAVYARTTFFLDWIRAALTSIP